MTRVNWNYIFIIYAPEKFNPNQRRIDNRESKWKYADGGGINKIGNKIHLPVPADFVVEGLDGKYRGYTWGDLWNGYEVPYFNLDVAKKIAEDSFHGVNETHLVYDAKKNVSCLSRKGIRWRIFRV